MRATRTAPIYTERGSRLRVRCGVMSYVGVARGLRGLGGVLLALAVCVISAPGAGASSWKRETLGPAGGDLSAVSCVSKHWCVAVGFVFKKNKRASVVTLAELWDGSRWTRLATADPTRSRDRELSGVSCSSSTACTAVGFWMDGHRSLALVERWDGLRWSVQRPRWPRGGSDFSAVSCPSASACVAVGDESNHSLIERWNGARWSIQRSPKYRDPKQGLELSQHQCAPDACTSLAGVSCFSAGDCTAVGAANDGFVGMVHTWAAHWNGGAWVTRHSPVQSPDSGEDDELDAVSCPGRHACLAVGDSNEYSVGAFGLWGRWSGGWWSTTVASGVLGKQGPVVGVSCVSASACTAVSQVNEADGNAPAAIDRWNGTRWTIEATISSNEALAGVSCAARAGCVAVGTVLGGPNSPAFAVVHT
jgi:hypothetical protein